jgi:glycosyltransferase 2 family protein
MTPQTKHRLTNAVRIAVCIGGLIYIGWQITWHDYVRVRAEQGKAKTAPRYRLVAEYDDHVTVLAADGRQRSIPRSELGPVDIERGLPSMLRRMSGWLTGLAAACYLPVLFICSLRFIVVMSIQGVRLSVWEAVKITYAGAFLNFAMPGSTGGDLYRAYCVARRTDRKTEAATAVFIDRVIGLSSMMMLGGAMSLVGWAIHLEIGWAARAIGLMLVLMIVGAGLFFSQTFRRLIRYDRILQRLPLSHQFQRIDQAFFVLSHHKRKVALSLLLTVILQLFAMVALVIVAAALGMKTDSLPAYLVYLPLGMVVRAIPVSIQGAGPMDWCFQRFFVDSALGTPQQVQVLAVAVRLFDLLWAIPGVLVLLTGTELPPKDYATESDEDKSLSDKKS